jgi:Fungal cellulose binding domain
MKLVSLIAAMAVILSAAAAVSSTCLRGGYGYCGGRGWIEPTCCLDGYECKRTSNYSARCVKKPYAGPCVLKWGQCGGTGILTTQCCEPGYECKFYSPRYAQCVVAVPCVLKWGQCGGTGIPTPQCCEPGYMCKFYSPNYAQCIVATSTN